MNNFETIILNVHPATADSQGRFTMLAHAERPGYLAVEHFEALAEAGRISIHRIGGSEIASQYGRIPVAYTINK